VDYRSVHVSKGFERARSYARRALELDDTMAEAHASLAWTRFIYDWDWDGAGREFRRAIELDARYATAHQWYAFLLAAQSKLDMALVEGHTAQELDPVSVSVRRSLGALYMYARRLPQARYHLERAIAMNPDAEETHRSLGLILALEGNYPESQRVLRHAASMPSAGSLTRATLAYALAMGGSRDEAVRIQEGLEMERDVGYVSPVAFAMVHLGLGDIEAAMTSTYRAYDERRGWMAYVKVNPVMDPMRSHPRFDSLVRKLGL
jgi:Flp pilus assembly protein TadD